MKKSFEKSLIWVVTVTLSLNGTPFTSKAYAQLSPATNDPNQKIMEKAADPTADDAAQDEKKEPAKPATGMQAYQEYPAEEKTLGVATKEDEALETSDDGTKVITPRPSGGNILYDAEGNPVAMTNAVVPSDALPQMEEKPEEPAERVLKTLGEFNAASTEDDLTAEKAPETISTADVLNRKTLSTEEAAVYITEKLQEELKTDVKVEVAVIKLIENENMTSDIMAAGGIMWNRMFLAHFSYITAEGRGGKAEAHILLGLNGIHVRLSGIQTMGNPPIDHPPVPLPPAPIDPTLPPPGNPDRGARVEGPFVVVYNNSLTPSLYMQNEVMLKSPDGKTYFTHFPKDQQRELTQGKHIFASLSDNGKKMVEGRRETLWDAVLIEGPGGGILSMDLDAGQKIDDDGMVINDAKMQDGVINKTDEQQLGSTDVNNDGVVNVKDNDLPESKDRNEDGADDARDGNGAKAQIGAFHVPADRLILVKGLIERFKSDASDFLISHGIDAIDGGGRKFGDEQKLDVDDNGIFYARLKADHSGIHRIHLLQRIPGGEDRVIAETKVEVPEFRKIAEEKTEADVNPGSVKTQSEVNEGISFVPANGGSGEVQPDANGEVEFQVGVIPVGGKPNPPTPPVAPLFSPETKDTEGAELGVIPVSLTVPVESDGQVMVANEDAGINLEKHDIANIPEAPKPEAPDVIPVGRALYTEDADISDKSLIPTGLAVPEKTPEEKDTAVPETSIVTPDTKDYSGYGKYIRDIDPKNPDKSMCDEGDASVPFSAGGQGNTGWNCYDTNNSSEGSGIRTEADPVAEDQHSAVEQPKPAKDINRDGELDDKDRERLGRPPVAVDPVEPPKPVQDINRDGELDDKDRERLGRPPVAVDPVEPPKPVQDINRDGELDDKDRKNLPRVLEVRVPEPKKEPEVKQDSKEWAVVKLKMPEEKPSSDEGLKPVDPQTFMIKAVSRANQKPGSAIATAALQTPEVQRFFTAVMDIQPKFVPMTSAESPKSLTRQLKVIRDEAVAVLKDAAEKKIEEVKAEAKEKEASLKENTPQNSSDNSNRITAVLPIRKESEKPSAAIVSVREDVRNQIETIRKESQNRMMEFKKLAETAIAAVKNFKMTPLAAAPVITPNQSSSFATNLTGPLLGNDDKKILE